VQMHLNSFTWQRGTLAMVVLRILGLFFFFWCGHLQGTLFWLADSNRNAPGGFLLRFSASLLPYQTGLQSFFVYSGMGCSVCLFFLLSQSNCPHSFHGNAQVSSQCRVGPSMDQSAEVNKGVVRRWKKGVQGKKLRH
jgi:hypothetical protein